MSEKGSEEKGESGEEEREAPRRIEKAIPIIISSLCEGSSSIDGNEPVATQKQQPRVFVSWRSFIYWRVILAANSLPTSTAEPPPPPPSTPKHHPAFTSPLSHRKGTPIDTTHQPASKGTRADSCLRTFYLRLHSPGTKVSPGGYNSGHPRNSKTPFFFIFLFFIFLGFRLTFAHQVVATNKLPGFQAAYQTFSIHVSYLLVIFPCSSHSIYLRSRISCEQPNAKRKGLSSLSPARYRTIHKSLFSALSRKNVPRSRTPTLEFCPFFPTVFSRYSDRQTTPSPGRR